MTLIRADHLSVIRQGQTILENVSLSIDAKDFLTVIGPNGAGKTVLLQALMGFFPPDKGIVTRQENIRIGYVPQRLQTDRSLPLRVCDFISLGKKISAGELENILTETGIAEIQNHLLHVLSGGELQRVLLARALVGKPQLLVLDEPAQNLDIAGQLSFYALLEKIYHERKLAVLMVSHDLHLVMASSTRVLCLYHHVCCMGEPHQVAKDPEFIALFGNEMARMMAVYHHHHDHTHDHEHGHAHD